MSLATPEQQHAATLAENTELRARARVAELERHLEWFQRQLFGSRSEKRLEIDPAAQHSLLAGLVEDAPAAPPAEAETRTITRRAKVRDGAVNDTGLRFDERVPVRVIEVAPSAGTPAEAIIDTRSTFRLAQRRASYEVLEYRCPVVKAADSAKLTTTPVPGNVFRGTSPM